MSTTQYLSSGCGQANRCVLTTYRCVRGRRCRGGEWKGEAAREGSQQPNSPLVLLFLPPYDPGTSTDDHGQPGEETAGQNDFPSLNDPDKFQSFHGQREEGPRTANDSFNSTDDPGAFTDPHTDADQSTETDAKNDRRNDHENDPEYDFADDCKDDYEIEASRSSA